MNVARIWNDPAERRKWITATSGVLIALALVAGRVVGWSEAGPALMTAAALLAGGDIATRAWAAVRVRHLGIEVLVTIAAVGALIIGEVWEAAAVTFLFALGGYLEARTRAGTRRAIEALLDVAPATAVVLRSGDVVTVPADEVRAGEVVLIKPGAQVPVDGEVVQGHGAIDESAITGESVPAEKGPGSAVFAGTFNQGSLLRVRATGVGEDTTLARIIRRVEEAQEAKAPAQRFIERFARVYTPAILGLSGVAYLISGDPRLALTLLVIGCPGALVISIPVSIVAGIGRAAREGILIKGGEHLERTARITAIAFDKTGTLTEGRPRLSAVVARAPESCAAASKATPAPADDAELSACAAALHASPEECAPEQRELLRHAAIAESGSEHPLARPVLAAAGAMGRVPTPDRFEAVAGHGIRAVHEGTRVEVGSARAMDAWDVAVPAAAERWAARIAGEGGTPMLVAVDGEFAGLLGVKDTPRRDAAEALDGVRAMGVRRTIMLTGDGRPAAEAVAGEVGIEEVHAELLPDQKLEWIRRLRHEGQDGARVRNGSNDAPALAAADVGIAMGAAGTDVAIETADIALMADDLRKIPRAIGIARRTRANMRQNVVIALATVAALLAGVLAGEVHMAGGMLIHELSVLAVIANGMRLTRA